MNNFTINEVESGTVIERNGEKLTVTNTEVVFKGNHIYMTPMTYAALKTHPEVKTQTSRYTRV